MNKPEKGLKVRSGLKGGAWSLQDPVMDLNQVVFCDSYWNTDNGASCLECTDYDGNPLFSSCNF